MDVVDFRDKSALYGYRYAIVFVGHYTNGNRVYGAVNIKRLDTIVDAHLTWVKTGFPKSHEMCSIFHEQTSHTFQTIKSDGARYWNTPAMREVYAKHRAPHIMSSPNRQERNGKCERYVRTLKQSASAMRAAQSLGKTWWWAALEHASHTTQLLRTSANPGNLSPYEMLTGRPPSHTHLHVFGSRAEVTRPNDKIQTHQHRAEVGMYIGWDSQRRAHKVLFPPSAPGTGPEEMRHLRSQQPDALPQRSRLQLVHVAPEDTRIRDGLKQVGLSTPSVPYSDAYDPLDADDDDDQLLLIVGNQTVEVPLQDRSTTTDAGDGTLDLDYHLATNYASVDFDHHATHCTVTPNGCRCMGWSTNQSGGTITLDRVAVILPSTSDALSHARIALPKPTSGYLGSRSRRDTNGYNSHEYDRLSRLHSYPKTMAVGVCNTWKQAKESEHVHHYTVAKQKERDKLLHPTTGVMRPIAISKVPSGQRILPSSMRFVLKTDENNKITKGKARWVAGGHRMRPGIDYDESHADCPHWSSVRLFWARCAKLGRTMRTGDIESAYTKGPPQRIIYLRSPSGQTEYDEHGEELVYECFGNLYGKKDAGHVWGLYLTNWLVQDQGYTQCPNDPCIFKRKKGAAIPEYSSGGASGGTAKPTTALEDSEILVYVDDLAYHAATKAATDQLEQALVGKWGDIGAHEPAMYLGANILQDDRGIHICHRAMIERLGKTYYPELHPSMYNLKGAQTPFPSHGSALGATVSLADCPNIEAGEPPLNAPYRELVGSLSYIATTTRPDIAWYTSQLARVQSNPGKPHFLLAKRVLMYLLNTPNHGLRYYRNGLGMEYYVDSSFADIEPTYTKDAAGVLRTSADDDGRRSSYGYIGFYASGPITWASRMHKGIRTLSTCEAELVAATHASKDILHMRYVASDLGIDTSKPTPLYEDNQSTLALILKQGVTSSRTKHIQLAWFFVRELQKEGHINTLYKHTSEQVAGILTKRLATDTFTGLRNSLVDLPSPPGYVA
jgi:hypothetical protein